MMSWMSSSICWARTLSLASSSMRRPFCASSSPTPSLFPSSRTSSWSTRFSTGGTYVLGFPGLAGPLYPCPDEAAGLLSREATLLGGPDDEAAFFRGQGLGLDPRLHLAGREELVGGLVYGLLGIFGAGGDAVVGKTENWTALCSFERPVSKGVAAYGPRGHAHVGGERRGGVLAVAPRERGRYPGSRQAPPSPGSSTSPSPPTTALSFAPLVVSFR